MKHAPAIESPDHLGRPANRVARIDLRVATPLFIPARPSPARDASTCYPGNRSGGRWEQPQPWWTGGGAPAGERVPASRSTRHAARNADRDGDRSRL